jgi:CTP synthase
LICRCEQPISRDERDKIALFCNLQPQAVIEERDKDFSIYEVPLSLVTNGLDELIVKRLGLSASAPNLEPYNEILHRLRNPKHEISIAVVGKYAEHKDAYKSIYESLDHAGIHHHAQIRIGRIQSADIENEGPECLLSGYDGILVPGGFGERGIEGKVQAIRYAREKGIPFFGICLGMQCAVIEYGRHVIGLDKAHSTEFDKDTAHPVICLLDEQREITHMGGTMRLGSQPAKLVAETRARLAYGEENVAERHRHRYEFNNVYRQQFAAHGMTFAGTSPDGELVEIVEVADHPWFLAVQFHPEFKSKPTKAHPLFASFIQAAVDRRARRQKKTPEASQQTV